MIRMILRVLMLFSLLTGMSASAGWTDYLDKLESGLGGQADSVAATGLSNDEMVSGLKEALGNGTQHAVEQLGREGGFLDNSKVRIPMPESLQWVETSLRTLKQDALADEFVQTMNHAAERAVPEAAAIFGDAISRMTIEDAQKILSGPDDAATRYFRDNTEDALTDKMRPIVEQATAKTGVTSAYKNMTAQAGGLAGLVGDDATDLDGYVTGKTLDGLFLMIAEEEKKIRENPLARSSELLKKVFGAYQ